MIREYKVDGCSDQYAEADEPDTADRLRLMELGYMPLEEYVKWNETERRYVYTELWVK